jgi:hypothetical protein
MLIRHDNDIIQAIDAMMGLAAPFPTIFIKRRLKTVYTQQQQIQYITTSIKDA